MSTDVVVATTNGVTVTSAMTPEERFNAHLQAAGGQPIDFKGRGREGMMPLHVHPSPTGGVTFVGDAAPGTVGGKAAPPSSTQLERQNSGTPGVVPPQGTPEERARDTSGRFAPKTPAPQGAYTFDPPEDVEIDTAHPIVAGLTDWARANNIGQEAFSKLFGMIVEYEAAQQTIPDAPAQSDDWQRHVEDGEWVGLENLTLAHTGGYTLERYRNDQRLHTSAILMLRDARAAGISQEQINAFFRQGAIRNGWIKA